MDYALLCLCLILLFYVASVREPTMASIADLNKHIENMKRAKSIVDKAANDADKHAGIMDNFEKRLSANDENMGKLEEYNKMMDAMDALGNGGPALETTFPSSTEGSSTAPIHGKATVGMFNH
jgi:hypothetical protein